MRPTILFIFIFIFFGRRNASKYLGKSMKIRSPEFRAIHFKAMVRWRLFREMTPAG